MRFRHLLAFLLMVPGGVVIRAQAIPQLVDIVVFRVNYLSLQPERYYEMRHLYRPKAPLHSCGVAASLNFCIEPAGGFGYTEVSSVLTGLQVFRAATQWPGRGEWEYPANPLSTVSSSTLGTPTPADTVVTVTPFYGRWGQIRVVADETAAAWMAVAGTEPIRLLTEKGPIEVVVFEHFYTIGVRDPNTAEWIVVAYTVPPTAREH